MPTFDSQMMDAITIDWEGIYKLIDDAKMSPSEGADGISNKMLKNTITYSSLMLSEMFTQSLQVGTIPDDWKGGKVVPVHKSAPSYVSSRIDHRFKVSVPSCRTNQYFHSFLPKTSSDGNHLPACTRKRLSP
ncbi:uncharacterized protein LOC144126380 [Amblyomma americanum]